MLCGSLDGKVFGGECIPVYVQLSHSAVHTLLMGCTPIQNKSFFLKKKEKKGVGPLSVYVFK